VNFLSQDSHSIIGSVLTIADPVFLGKVFAIIAKLEMTTIVAPLASTDRTTKHMTTNIVPSGTKSKNLQN